MPANRTIDRPIFVIGSQRGGTTAILRRLSLHPDLAWLSNVTKRFPQSLWVTWLALGLRGTPKPAEGNKVWGYRRNQADDHRGVEDATPDERRYLHRVVSNHLRLFDKPRFMNKAPRNTQ